VAQGWAARAAFFLLATSLLLPWWTATNPLSEGTIASETLWSRGPEVVAAWTWVTLALAAPAVVLLFVRVAAASWRHEPRSWRRDLAVCLGLCAGALASAWRWPRDLPFWGTLDFTLEGMRFVLVGRPGLGWWLAAIAAALVAVELLLSRRAATPDPA
jgi:hypothetical protein